jgi:hypothetical protein
LVQFTLIQHLNSPLSQLWRQPEEVRDRSGMFRQT